MSTLKIVKNDNRFRNTELARIHVLKNKLGMDDETYRDVLWSVARVTSAADLDWAGRKRVVDHLAKQERAQEKRLFAVTRKQIDGDPMLRKCRALWINIKKAGGLRDGSDQALAKWLCDKSGLSHIRFLDEASRINPCIEALKQWLARLEYDAQKAKENEQCTE